MMPNPSPVDEEDLNDHDRMVKRVCYESNSNDCSHDDEDVFVGLREEQVRRNIEAVIQSVIDGDSSGDDIEQNTRVATSLTDDEVRRRLHYIMFGTGHDDDEDEHTLHTGGDDEQDQHTIHIENEFHSLLDGSDDDSLHSMTQSIQEEGSISSIELDDLDNRLQVDFSLASRKRTHVENEKARQYNLFLLLPQLHQQRMRLESRRIVGHDRECDMCQEKNPPMLWQCNECTLLKYSSPRLCEDCILNTHLNMPHSMDVLYRDETIFRKPFFHETITFRLAILACPSCNSTNCFQPDTVSVLIASQNGIFRCTCPAGGSKCHDCGDEVINTSIAFDCLPCEPVHQSGCTWFTKSLLSFIRTLRSEGGISANALARAIMEHWQSRNLFLAFSPGRTNRNRVDGNFPFSNITVHWLEKKIAQIMTTGILLEHPSWSDEHECFKLEDRLSSVCAACHDTCAQIHIDGFFKMRRMKRARSYREPKLHFFGRVAKEKVDGFRQIDLQNREEEVAMCEDLAGNLTEFRAGDGRQQAGSVGYSQTGILTAVCPHRVACTIIPMETKGEKFFMPHAMLDFFEGGNYSGSVDFYSYDVACRLKSYLEIRDPALHVKVGPKLVLGYFHSKSHRCHRWNVGYTKVGSGYNDGEQGERLNKLMLKYTSFLRYMREEHMNETLEDFLMCHTRQANATIDVVLHTKLINSVSHLIEWHGCFVRLCMELENRLSPQGFHLNIESIQQWVEEYSSWPVAGYQSIEMTGSKVEQEYVWAHYEWMQLGANHTEAVSALQQINQLGEHLVDGLLQKKKYLIMVVKAYERMAKKRVCVSA